ncbi:hypothetical protein COLO4_20574 [Corchorus olitorius]|uniref:Uncharacterized protein n=1 Tax=Corchorus olitorius TaxID=93759 RepID=A0A1R3IYW1_9ROSI|nr:hypothetical protein COLO4_20574 [Corchorus olitorius]
MEESRACSSRIKRVKIIVLCSFRIPQREWEVHDCVYGSGVEKENGEMIPSVGCGRFNK